MEPVEIKILKYTFRFRHLSWREEVAIKFGKNADRVRVVLAHALTEVSGLKIGSVAEATKVLNAVPGSVIQRMLILYKGSLPIPRRFSTTDLYRAPNTVTVAKRLEEVEQTRDKIMDKVEAEMRQKFGNQEIEETLEAERLMMKNSKMRGATRATDERVFGETPPPGKKKNAN
jgi:hypothetical protein